MGIVDSDSWTKVNSQSNSDNKKQGEYRQALLPVHMAPIFGTVSKAGVTRALVGERRSEEKAGTESGTI